MTQDLAGHLNEMQIVARQLQTLFSATADLIEIGGDQALDTAVRVAEVGRDLAHRANVELDSVTLMKWGIGV